MKKPGVATGPFHDRGVSNFFEVARPDGKPEDHFFLADSP
jgi:hypothetical protein